MLYYTSIYYRRIYYTNDIVYYAITHMIYYNIMPAEQLLVHGRGVDVSAPGHLLCSYVVLRDVYVYVLCDMFHVICFMYVLCDIPFACVYFM